MSKVAIISYSGKVGKTSIAAHTLAPRMNVDKFYAIETTNETAEALGIKVEQISGEKFGYLYKQLLMLEDAIVDVGASNIEDFLTKMIKVDESHIEFDYFLVPVGPESSIQRECLKTIQTLSDIGIPGNKIRVVFNKVKENVEEEFSGIFAYAKKTKNCIANPDCAIDDDEAFEMLAARKMNIGQVIADQTDYRGLAKQIAVEIDRERKAGEVKKDDERDKKHKHYSDRQFLRASCIAVNRNLQEVFDALFK